MKLISLLNSKYGRFLIPLLTIIVIALLFISHYDLFSVVHRYLNKETYRTMTTNIQHNPKHKLKSHDSREHKDSHRPHVHSKKSIKNDKNRFNY